MPASASPTEHSVLLIEEYDALAVAIESALKKFAPQHRVLIARTLPEARNLALAHGPGLIILDFDPPHPNALAFFDQLRTALPDTRVLVIAAGTPHDLPAERADRGMLQFLEKPFELVDFGAAVQALLGPWRETGASRGTLRDFALIDAVALGCLAGGDSVIQLQAGEKRSGQIHFHNGHVVHATTSDKEGEDALVEMLCWEEVSFIEMPRISIPRHSIHKPWIPALADVLRAVKHRRPAPSRPHAAAPEEKQTPAKTGPKILIIDDTEMLLIFVEDSLTMAQPDLQIITAATGLLGAKEAERVVPDLILCDYSLPDIKGDEVCRRIAASTATAHVPIIMMSGHVHEMTAVAVKLPNVVATIAKPFRSETLVALVQKTLREGGLREKRPGPLIDKPDSSPLPAAKSTATTAPPEEPPLVSEFLQPQIASPISRAALTRAVAAQGGSPQRTNLPRDDVLKAAPELQTNEILLDLPLDVVAMQVDSSFQIGSIRARPASPTVAIQIPALAARAALPLETGFLLGPVDVDAAGQIVAVRLLPTLQPFRQVESRTAFAIGGLTVLP
ncbi:MAG: response regulator, partial [Verrucomicrobia bacterium]|nr:response regulator [Verrucomicrobiota bacterium]